MKQLSIAIPTLNRASYLRFTLEQFVPQVQGFVDEVEILVCNNASDDETLEVMAEICSKYKFIYCSNCQERLPLGEQFKRTVSLSRGQYIILWGDDDIPAPYLVSYLLYLIKNSEGCGLYYFNRMVGYEDGNSLKSLTVYKNRYNNIRKIYDDSSKFIEEHFWGATFMSSIMFNRNVWERGLKFDTDKHYGFEFMGILYYGNKNGLISYDQFPVCIQRKVAKRAWGIDWPKYALLGLPNMSSDLEKEGIFIDGLNVWRNKYNKLLLFCYILMSAATNKKKYKPLCAEFAFYQNNIIRKALIYVIIYLFPGCFYNISRKVLFKLKK